MTMPGEYKVRAFIFTVALLSSFSVFANVTLKPINVRPYEKTIYDAASQYHIENGSPVDKQAFSVNSDGKHLGDFIAGQGFNAQDDAVCFIAWSDGNGKIQRIVPTIGFDNWEAETCTGTKAVGVLADDDKGSTKLAVIYSAQSPNAIATESVIFSIDKETGALVFDKELTRKLSVQSVGTLTALNDLYNKKKL